MKITNVEELKKEYEKWQKIAEELGLIPQGKDYSKYYKTLIKINNMINQKDLPSTTQNREEKLKNDALHYASSLKPSCVNELLANAHSILEWLAQNHLKYVGNLSIRSEGSVTAGNQKLSYQRPDGKYVVEEIGRTYIFDNREAYLNHLQSQKTK